MCGIIGFLGKEKVVDDLVLGLTALQHRGQDAAGIVTFNKKGFRLKKGRGLVSNVFEQRHAELLKGKMGIGHVRYTTQSTNDDVNAQPFVANYPFGIAMVHNGNVVNFEELKRTLYEEHHILPETSNDLELILYTLASELQAKNLKTLTIDDIFDAVTSLQKKINGAYSTIVAIANHGLLAFTDPNGIRPLILGKREGKKGMVYGFASESTCLDYLEYEVVTNLEPGEIVFIDKDNLEVHRRIGHQQKRAFCVFEYIYFAREDSIIHNKLVAKERVIMGRKLAKKITDLGLKPDIVIDVPNSGYFAASGLAEALNIPYRRGLVKNSHVGRSFIMPNQKDREKLVKKKLNPIKEIVAGKKIAVVDDSVVRGTTSKRIVKILKDAGAKEVYFVSAAPPIKHPCIYGIDMAVTTELIASGKTDEEVGDFIGADVMIYQNLTDLKNLYKEFNICTACFNNDYPTDNAENYLASITKERISSR